MNTALGINLQEENGHIRVVYGCGSTAFTKFAGTENALIERGFWGDCDITIRNGLLITHPDDEPSAEAKIRAYLSQFDGVEKDALLSLTKECRKGFIRQVALKMKPLGFNKRASNGPTHSRPAKR